MPAVLVLLAMTALAAPPPAPVGAQALADAFVAALRRDDPAAFDAIAVGGRADEQRWQTVLSALALYDELRPTPPLVLAVSEHTDRALIDIAFAGNGLTAGGRRDSVPLPGRWRLVAVHSSGGWAIDSAITAERLLAETLAAATAAELDAALAADPGLDVHCFLIELADTASETADLTMEGAPPALAWALAKSRELGDVAAESEALRMRSYAELNLQRRPEAALASAAEALAVAERAGDEDSASRSRFSLGVVHWFAGDVPLAVETLQQAARNMDALRDPRSALRALYMAGSLEWWSGRLRSALTIASEHERQLRRFPSRRSAMDGRFLLASLHRQLGSDDYALRAFSEAEELARLLGDRKSTALARFGLATVEAAAGRRSAARDLLARTVADVEGVEPTYVPSFHAELGSLQMELGEMDAADASLAEALALARSHDLQGVAREVLARQSELRLRQGRSREALELAQEATAAHAEEPTRLYLPVTPGRGRRALGLSLQALGRLAEAEVAFRDAIEELEAAVADPSSDPLATRGGDATASYRSLVVLLAMQGRGAEALAIADRMRARTLRQALERGHVDLSATLSAAERAREDELDEQLVELNRSALAAPDAAARQRIGAARDEARLALQRFRAELYALHPTLPQRRAESAGDPREGWRRAIAAGGVAVEWVVAEDHTLAFLVTRRGDGEVDVAVRRIEVSDVSLAAAVDRLSSKLASRDPAIDRPARELYQLLLAPLADELRGASVLMIVPDGVLWRLPFQVLRDADGRELVERMAVFRAPSLAAVALAAGDRAEPVAHPRLLALGNPDLGGAGAAASSPTSRGRSSADLPAAEREVRSLGRLYGAGRAELHVGAAARERLLKERVAFADVIHLATHGRLDDRTPLFSALELATAPGDREDGLLEVREIADLDLRGRLVVLSACETGAGRWREGEGLVGMAWALMAAGSPAAVVSDWKVDSAATEPLMVELHRRLLAGDGAALALRRAQLDLRRDPRYAHPYYWAAFGVLGTGW